MIGVEKKKGGGGIVTTPVGIHKSTIHRASNLEAGQSGDLLLNLN